MQYRLLLIHLVRVHMTWPDMYFQYLYTAFYHDMTSQDIYLQYLHYTSFSEKEWHIHISSAVFPCPNMSCQRRFLCAVFPSPNMSCLGRLLWHDMTRNIFQIPVSPSLITIRKTYWNAKCSIPLPQYVLSRKTFVTWHDKKYIRIPV